MLIYQVMEGESASKRYNITSLVDWHKTKQKHIS